MTDTIESYDDIPYDSTPIRETLPAHLAVQAALFGLTPPDPARCRVLELGCANGGNLIPMAFYSPESEFLGIELSQTQAQAGQALIERLNLKNIRIHHADILRTGDLGRFDYLICHGVYSWAPPVVRERILALCQETLTPKGIAYISYNTLPGWRPRTALRDMLLYIVRKARTPRERLAAAYAGLEKMETAFAAQQDSISQYVCAEIASLRGRDPSYLYHEYLEEVNEALLFSAFMAQARRYGLQYVCETEMHTMFPDTLPETGAALVDSFDDVIEQEQAMDFLRNRTFRQTLLCREGQPLNRELELERFAQFAYYALLTPHDQPDLAEPKPQAFATPDGSSYTITHPLTKAAVLILSERHPDALDFDVLAEEAARRAKGPCREERDHLLGELVGLYLRQVVGIGPAPQAYVRTVSARPRANALARMQAETGLGHIATVRHMPMALDAFALRLVATLDGVRSREALVDQLTRDVAEGVLRIEDAPRGDALKPAIRTNCQHLLAQFARHGILEG